MIIDRFPISFILRKEEISGWIEKRFLGQWPEKKMILFFCTESRFPIPLETIADIIAKEIQGE